MAKKEKPKKPDAPAPDAGAEGEGAPVKKKMAGKTLVLFIILPAVLVLGGGGAAAMMLMGGGGAAATRRMPRPAINLLPKKAMAKRLRAIMAPQRLAITRRRPACPRTKRRLATCFRAKRATPATTPCRRWS
jgi:hypothetical protein